MWAPGEVFTWDGNRTISSVRNNRNFSFFAIKTEYSDAREWKRKFDTTPKKSAESCEQRLIV